MSTANPLICTSCGHRRCVCVARENILAAAAEINAALRVVDYARRVVDPSIKRDGVLHEIDMLTLKEAIDSYDLLVAKRVST